MTDYFGHRKRLKERFMLSKKGTIASYELLELLLFFVKPRSDVKPLAKELLNRFGNISTVLNASYDDLEQIKGIGQSAMVLFRCIQEVIERILQDDLKERPIINNWKTLLKYLTSSIGTASTEKVRVLYLNKKYMLLSDELQDVGTIDQTPLYVREIIKRALVIGATSLVIAHNHPSGDPSPSHADIDITRQLMDTCMNIGIQLIDHVILSRSAHFSFKKEGML